MTTVETIRTAGTSEEVKAVLLGSARVADMAEAYQAVTGYSYSGQLRGISREEIASNMASQIMTMKGNGFFKALSVEEKYEELKTLKELPRKLCLCTMGELEAIAGILEIDEAEYGNKSGYDKKRELESQITVKLEVKRLEELKTAGSHEEMREMLKMCDTSRLAEIAKMVGSDFWERIAEAREEHSGADLIEWAIGWIIERLGVGADPAPAEDEGVETEMETAKETAAPVEMEAENHAETETEAPAETAESVKAEIAFTLEGHTAASLKNLVNTIYSRGRLMSKATGGDFRVSDKLVEELKEYGSTVEEVLRIIRSAGEDSMNGLAFEEDKVVFTGFPATEDALKTRAYILLAAAINKSSLEQKRIQAKKVDESNEKFAFRVWLVRLGLNGAETKAERKTFYANLTGHTAFRTKADEEKWYARRKAAASAVNADSEEVSKEGMRA